MSAPKSVPVGAEIFRAGGRTHMTKLTVTFRNLANATENAGVSSGTHPAS